MRLLNLMPSHPSLHSSAAKADHRESTAGKPSPFSNFLPLKGGLASPLLHWAKIWRPFLFAAASMPALADALTGSWNRGLSGTAGRGRPIRSGRASVYHPQLVRRASAPQWRQTHSFRTISWQNGAWKSLRSAAEADRHSVAPEVGAKAAKAHRPLEARLQQRRLVVRVKDLGGVLLLPDQVERDGDLHCRSSIEIDSSSLRLDIAWRARRVISHAKTLWISLPEKQQSR